MRKLWKIGMKMHNFIGQPVSVGCLRRIKISVVSGQSEKPTAHA